MPDPRDLGNRPIVEAMLPLMDKLEAQERVANAAAFQLEREAEAKIKAGAYGEALEIFRAIVQLYRAADVCPYRIPEYEQRARDCEGLLKMKRRSKAPGRKGR